MNSAYYHGNHGLWRQAPRVLVRLAATTTTETHGTPTAGSRRRIDMPTATVGVFPSAFSSVGVPLPLSAYPVAVDVRGVGPTRRHPAVSASAPSADGFVVGLGFPIIIFLIFFLKFFI